jgi:hypothetical protein
MITAVLAATQPRKVPGIVRTKAMT